MTRSDSDDPHQRLCPGPLSLVPLALSWAALRPDGHRDIDSAPGPRARPGPKLTVLRDSVTVVLPVTESLTVTVLLVDDFNKIAEDDDYAGARAVTSRSQV